MNRHKKFYSTLRDKMCGDDYDDYYEEEEDNFYDEEDLQYIVQAGAIPAQPVKVSATAGCSATQGASSKEVELTSGKDYNLCPDDLDYSLIITLLTEFKRKWGECASVQALKLDPALCDIVDAFREHNYDVDEAVAYMVSKLTEEQSRVGTQNLPQLSSPLPHPVNVGVPASTTTSTSTAGLKPGGRTLKLGKGSKSTDKPTINASEGVTKTMSTMASGAHRTGGISKLKKNKVQEIMPDPNKRDCTFVIAGHVDAGKSTTLGHLLLLLGRVSQSDVDRNERSARQLNKESFKYAWLLDQSEEERRRGVTIDSGSYCFETEHRRINILDAPGHKDYVLSMISSATQADAALLVVTVAPSEFEVGLSHGTKEHLFILKTLSVGRLIVAVNKMDAVDYSKDRYDHVVLELKRLLKQIRFKEEAIVGFCPVSGMRGTNLLTVDHAATPWYKGPSLVQLFDQCPLENRLLDAPLRLSLQDVQGARLFCKVESGRLSKASKVLLLPADVTVHVKTIVRPTTGELVTAAFAGDAVELDTDSSLVGLFPGCVGCLPTASIRCSTDFEARVQTFATLQSSILPGTSFTMVVHALTVPVKVLALVSKMDCRGNWSKGMVKCIPKATQAIIVFRAASKIALEPAEACRALGRFLLQQDGNTVAGGLVEKMML
ncbi:Hsp70 subfamily B suppressor 1 [Trypanosoma rangeli]|uniref:Hsp70 subfamily B suppressor 1 n=1 Tax=Trypanosoma rangeli TaxID=5698 RepID=A0A422NK97_TRYRA|nr:Hsp70 subfamily B suppressor 1 [Trypanosoma rangeli]RNF05881.1 Hsp70 subfamily B suppressor 1 [Trypanosoma rangeli]|eukprot:RNF05881.1 Hsp70 subfamily B suppressor 1 [Trypanosoma rangeli]